MRASSFASGVFLVNTFHERPVRHPMRLLLTLMFSTAALAQTIYKWEDRSGTHYADSPSAIPKSAKNIEVMQVVPKAPAPAPTTISVHSSPGQVWQDSHQLSESQWRDWFVLAYRRIQTLEASIAAAAANAVTVCPPAVIRNGVVVQQQPSGTACLQPAEFEQHRARLAQQKVDLADARSDLEQLERTASLEHVPREWRRGW